MVSTTTIIGGLIGLGALYGLYRAFSGSSSTVEYSEDPVNPTVGGRRTHKRKVHGQKTKKHYLKK